MAKNFIESWEEYIQEVKPVLDLLIARGCSFGEALIIIHLHMLAHQNETIDDDDIRPGDEWKYE